MSIVVIADSSCDLPDTFWLNQNLEVFPFGLLIDGVESRDTRDAKEMARFFSQNLIGKDHTAESMPLSKGQIVKYFAKNIVTKYDYALILTASKGRSETYKNFLAATGDILRNHRPFREAAGLISSFSMRVVNSGTLFSGLGVLVSHIGELAEQGLTGEELRLKAEAFKRSIYTYCVPHDLYYLSTRAKAKGDKSVSVAAAVVAKTLGITPVILGHMDDTNPVARIRGHENAVNRVFDLARLRIDAGLKSRRVVVSYAGELTDLNKYIGYTALKKHAVASDIIVETAVMSVVGGLNLGPKTLTVGFATDPHEFE